MNDIPTLSVDFIDELNKLFPPLCIGPQESLESAHRYAGKRELIDAMLQWKQRGDRQFPKR